VLSPQTDITLARNKLQGRCIPGYHNRTVISTEMEDRQISLQPHRSACIVQSRPNSRG
jgi:hypothetical protein